MKLTVKRNKFDIFEEASITGIELNEFVDILMALKHYRNWLKGKGIDKAARITELLRKLETS